MASASVPFQSARLLQRSRRLHRGWYVGSVLMVVSLVGGYSVYQSRPVVEHGVVVATRDIAPGSVLERQDLTTRSVVLDDTWQAALVPAQELDGLVGHVAPEPLHAGLPIARAQVAPHELIAPDQEAIELPVEPTAVANGSIQVGDWVQVWSTPKAAGARTVSVLARARVIDVDYERGGRAAVGTAKGAGSISGLVLALGSDEARAVTEAYRTASIDVARLPSVTGTEQTGTIPP
jgi:Flp pilus assembly protein CpaB